MSSDGAVINLNDLTRLGEVSAGFAVGDIANNRIFVFSTSYGNTESGLNLYDATTFLKIKSYELPEITTQDVTAIIRVGKKGIALRANSMPYNNTGATANRHHPERRGFLTVCSRILFMPYLPNWPRNHRFTVAGLAKSRFRSLLSKVSRTVRF